jgi:hypothetical protein
MRICLCVDVETKKFLTPAPQFDIKDRAIWELNKLRRYRYADSLDGFANLVEVLKALQVPATFFVVEQLKSQAAQIHQNNPLFDIGSHSYSHQALTLLDDNALINELNQCTGVSFGAPSNMIEDVNYPNRVIGMLIKRGFKIIRWCGVENGKQQSHKDGVSHVFKRQGILAVQGSMYFEGTSDDNHMTKVLYAIEGSKNLSDDYIFVLSTHDFSHRNTNNLFYLLNLIRTQFKFVNLVDLVQEASK